MQPHLSENFLSGHLIDRFTVIIKLKYKKKDSE